MSRVAAFALASVVGFACGRDSRPDVLLIVLDTVRADHLPMYGYARDTAPGLAELARDGVVYRNAISPDTWTAPSHASLLTDLMPTVHLAQPGPVSRSGSRVIRWHYYHEARLDHLMVRAIPKVVVGLTDSWQLTVTMNSCSA